MTKFSLLIPASLALILAGCAKAPGTVKETLQEVVPTIVKQLEPTIGAKIEETLETVAPTAAEVIDKVPTIKAALTPKPTVKPTIEP